MSFVRMGYAFYFFSNTPVLSFYDIYMYYLNNSRLISYTGPFMGYKSEHFYLRYQLIVLI